MHFRLNLFLYAESKIMDIFVLAEDAKSIPSDRKSLE